VLKKLGQDCMHKKFVFAAVFLLSSIPSCASSIDKSPSLTIEVFTLSLGSYLCDHGCFPSDPHGAEYALYQLRANMQTDDFCERCIPPFTFNHKNRTVENMKLCYANMGATPFVLDEGQSLLIAMLMTPDDDGRYYCVDSNLVIYAVKLNEQKADGCCYVGKSVQSLLLHANFVDRNRTFCEWYREAYSDSVR